jgi:hypothetical protein
LLFFLTAKITRSARLEKNVVYVAKIGGEISDFVCPVYFYHHPSLTVSQILVSVPSGAAWAT